MTLKLKHLERDKEGKIFITTDMQILQLGKSPKLYKYGIDPKLDLVNPFDPFCSLDLIYLLNRVWIDSKI